MARMGGVVMLSVLPVDPGSLIRFNRPCILVRER